MDPIPSDDCEFDEILRFAIAYNGYERIAGSPEALFRLYEPIRKEWEESGRLPDWAGLDLLRGLLFLMAREDHMAGPIFLEPTDAPGVFNMGNLPSDQLAIYEQPFRQLVEEIRTRTATSED